MGRIKRILLLIFILISLLPASIPVSAADQLDVHFELTRESPVSVEFRVTITNTGAVYKDIPLEVLFERLPVSSLKYISITEVTLATLTKEEPVYESVEQRYKPTGIVILNTTEGAKYFVETDTKTAAVVKEGYYEYYDNKTYEFVWHEDVQTGTRPIVYQEEQPETFKEWYTQNKTSKLTATFNQPAKDDNEFGFGAGVRVFDVKINTGLLKTGDGWGSAGLMVWDVAGKLFWDDTNSSWWDTDWLYRQDITINNADYAENLLLFPVGVFLTDSNFDFTQAQSDGDDIRFVDSDGATDLDHEVVSWDAVNEYAEIWVEVPQIDASSDTDYFTMYWGNSTCANGEDVAGTWNSGYVAVYHMNDNPADSTQILDSTSNGNTGTKGAGTAAPTEVAGLVGKAQSFDGGDDYIYSSGPFSDLSRVNAYTIEALVQTLSGGDAGAIVQSSLSDSDRNTIGKNSAGTALSYQVWDGSTYAYRKNSTTTPGEYYLLTGVSKGDLSYQGYLNGNGLTTSGNIFINRSGTSLLQIGRSATTEAYAYCVIAEIRLSKVDRSASWTASTNDTLRDNYLEYGTIQGKPLAPTNLTATASGNNIILDWTKGLYALDTVIVRGLADYPTSLTDGEVIYTGTLETFTEYGLASETATYFWSAFSSSDWGYSDDYTTVLFGGNMTDLFILAIEILFAFGIVALAYWRKEDLLYVLAGFTCYIFAFVWLQNLDTQYMQVIGVLAIGLGTVTFYLPVKNYLQKRR